MLEDNLSNDCVQNCDQNCDSIKLSPIKNTLIDSRECNKPQRKVIYLNTSRFNV